MTQKILEAAKKLAALVEPVVFTTTHEFHLGGIHYVFDDTESGDGQFIDALRELVLAVEPTSAAPSNSTPKVMTAEQLRAWLAALRFPQIVDLHEAGCNCFYATFASHPGTHLINSAHGFNLFIEKTNVVFKRYRLVFIPMDVEED